MERSSSIEPMDEPWWGWGVRVGTIATLLPLTTNRCDMSFGGRERPRICFVITPVTPIRYLGQQKKTVKTPFFKNGRLTDLHNW